MTGLLSLPRIPRLLCPRLEILARTAIHSDDCSIFSIASRRRLTPGVLRFFSLNINYGGSVKTTIVEHDNRKQTRGPSKTEQWGAVTVTTEGRGPGKSMAQYKKRGTNLTEYRGEETFDATKSSPRSQPYILALCLATFLIYFIILREENDIDNNIQILMYPMYKDGKKSLSPKEKPLHEAVSKEVKETSEKIMLQVLKTKYEEGGNTSELKEKLEDLHEDRLHGSAAQATALKSLYLP